MTDARRDPPRSTLRTLAFPLALSLALLFALAGCFNAGQDAPSDATPSRWLYWQSPFPLFGQTHRVAMLIADEGWGGLESDAPTSTLYSERYENGSLRIVVSAKAEGLAAECPAAGCYLYARMPGNEWTVLRAQPSDETRQWLVLSRPWALQALIESGPLVQLDLPVSGGRRCRYTFQTAGYQAALHNSVGLAALNGEGQPFEKSTSGDDSSWLQGPPREWVTWPECEAGAR